MPRYTLVGQDGESLGRIEPGRPDWPVGSIIYRGDQPNLRVVGHLEPDGKELDGVLVVEEV
jgi:hypothetical protein